MRQTDLVTHRIPTFQGELPKLSKPRLYTHEEIEIQKKLIPELLEAGIISYANSPWACQTKFVPKKNEGHRMVHNFIPVNKVIAKSNYPHSLVYMGNLLSSCL
jgi:hypothetical protein